MKKKILIIGNSFYPENSPRAFRTTELAKEFAKQGHDVTVLVPRENSIHDAIEKQYGFKIKDLGKRRFIKKKSISSKNKLSNFLERGIRRSLNLFFEYPNIEWLFKVKKALKNESDYDLLISIAVPHPIHWGTAWARTKQNQIAKTWVADCGDPFYFNSLDSFNKLFYFKYFEKWFSRKTDFISIPFEGLKKYFFKEFDNKYQVIPQGFNFKEIQISNKPINNKIVTFAYAGMFIKNKRDPGKLLDFLTTLDIPFQFILYNKQKHITDPYKIKLVDKLIVKDYIPRKELLFELSKMDFLVNFEYDPTNQAPSKLIDYSFTKRPILLIKNKEFDKDVIKEFLSKNFIHQFQYPNIEIFNIKNVVQQFLDLTE